MASQDLEAQSPSASAVTPSSTVPTSTGNEADGGSDPRGPSESNSGRKLRVSNSAINGSNGDTQNMDRESRDRFAEDDGQALLLAWDCPDGDQMAIEVHVNRPSESWQRRNRTKIEGNCPFTGEKVWKDNPADIKRFQTLGESDEKVWRRIRDEWYRNQPLWHRFLPFWRPIKVDEVSLEPVFKIGDKLRVRTYCAVPDPEAAIQTLQERLDRVEQDYAEGSEGSNHFCKGDYDEHGALNHITWSDSCLSGKEECILKQLLDTRNALRRMRKVHELTLCFKNPRIAPGRNTTAGFAQASFIYDEKPLRDSIAHSTERITKEPSSGEPLTYRGLRDTMDWQWNRGEAYLACSILATILVVLVSWLLTGKWSIATGFGSVVVGLLSIMIMLRQNK